jgi:hypothetical protein
MELGMAKSWSEKLADETPHQIKRMAVARAGVAKGGLMLLPSARMVDDFIRAIPRRHHVSSGEMRRILAARYGADGCCPVYTGYHLRTCVEAALEAFLQGTTLTRLTPVWRMLDEKTPTFKKLGSAGRFLITQRRLAEGL